MRRTLGFGRRRWERRMDAEFRFHLEARRNELIGQGMDPSAAELQARREFGSLELAKEECRDSRAAVWLTDLSRDIRVALRLLRKSPGFAAAAVATLALGIGANTAIFQLLNAVRIRTLPVANPQTLVSVRLADTKGVRGSRASAYPALTNPVWERFRDTQNVFPGVLAWGTNSFNLSDSAEPVLARGLFVSGDFFQVLGVEPFLGRVFAGADDRAGCGLPGAVISYSFWRREFAGDPSVIGRKLTINYQAVPVIGVTPGGFTGLEIGTSFDVAVPICSQAALWSDGNWLKAGTVWWLNVMARVPDAASLDRVNAQLRVASPGLFQTTLPANYPQVNVKDYLNFKLRAVPAGTGVSGLRETYGEALVFLLATSGLVLLIACANLANLILARATAREHEFAVRLAIGASRGRLIRQLMVENLLLASGGAAAGVLLARLLSELLTSMLGTRANPLFLDLQPDLRVLFFTLSLATLTCILFGLTPALRATRIAPGSAMKAGGRALSAGRERFELRQVLVIAQVALSLVLLVCALLFSGSLRNLLAVDAGFRQDGLTVATVDFRRSQIPEARRVAWKRDLLLQIRALPGVAPAALTSSLPLSGNGTENRVWRDGRTQDTGINAAFTRCGEGYLETMGITLLAGRDFTGQDNLSGARVAIVNQAFARALGLGADAVGARFRREATPSDPEQVYEIVGVVRDTKYYELREEFLPIVFLAAGQDPAPSTFAMLVMRAPRSADAAISAVRSKLARISPLATVEFQSFETQVREGLLRERLMATLSGFFGVLAVLISAVGLYGVMSYLVVRRTNEIGVRMALGAGRGTILALVLRRSAVLLGMGVAAGVVLSLAVAGAARSILFGLEPYDAGTLVVAVLLLAGVAALASYLPARRAAGMEPVAALRDE